MNIEKAKSVFHRSAIVSGIFVITALVATADDPPILQQPTIVSNQIQFTLTGATGSLYAVQLSKTLSNANWTSVKIDIGPMLFKQPATNAQQYYRGKALTNTSVSFANNVQPIFTASCATIGCHAGVAPSEGLNLSSGKAYAQIVNIPSSQCSDGRKRVLPGQPGQSYVIDKILGVNLCAGSPMPGTALPSAQIETIAEWIFEGTPNN